MRKLLSKVIRNRLTLGLAITKVVFDLVLYNIATVISVFIRFDFGLNPVFLHLDDPFGIIENAMFLIFCIVIGLPFHSFEYTSIKEVADIFIAVFLSKLFAFPFVYILGIRTSFSRGAYFVSFVIAFLLLSIARLSYRVIHEKRRKLKGESEKREKRVIILGAGDAGEKLLREILSHPELNYKIVGFLDDDPRKKRTTIHGYPVIAQIDRLPFILREYEIDVVIFAIPTAPGELLQKVISLTSNSNVEIKKLPAIWEIVSGRISIQDIKNVELEDLLPRASIKMDLEPVKEYIEDKVILITGAGGSIGSEIVRQVVGFKPKQLLILGRGENRIFDIELEVKGKYKFLNVIPLICDIRNREKVFKIFEIYKPDVVFHAAAHKHVPLMEKNPDEAILNNVFGTKNVLDASIEYGVERFINISTDKAVNPTNFMGVSKRLTELLVMYYGRHNNNFKCASVRFGNVLGSKGSVVEVFRRQIKETGVITVTDPNMERYFMLIPEAVQLVLYAGSMVDRGEIFVLKMGEPVNILEFAKQFVKLSGKELGKDVKIEIIGNRGGEKIKEELWSESEKIEPTENPYILRIKSSNNGVFEDGFIDDIEQLKNFATNFDIDGVKKVIKKLIPESEIN
ncbi:MAG: polysaccharide biosynthesis protein [Candidatus Parvarchaeota archaeon]|nr:polysaccharide biosynthesis protein [Candidatus Rehaiarchaeum fermentans]